MWGISISARLWESLITVFVLDYFISVCSFTEINEKLLQKFVAKYTLLEIFIISQEGIFNPV